MRRLAIFLLLLLVTTAPAAAQGFSPLAPAQTFTVVDAATHRPLAGAELGYQCPNGESGSGNTGPDGTLSMAFPDRTDCDLSVHMKNYPELERSWKASDPTTVEVAPADAAHPAWVDPMANFGGPPQMPSGGPVAAEEGNTWQAMIRDALKALLIAFLPAIAFFILREISVRTTLFLMMRRQGGAAPTAALEPPPAAAPPPPPVDTIEINTLNGLLLQGPSQARLERALDTHREKFKLIAWSVVPQLLGLVAAFSLAGPDASVFAPIVPAVIDLAFLWFLLSLYLQGKRLAEAAAVLGLLAGLAFTIAGRFLGIPLYLGILPPLLQGIFLVAGFRRIRRAARADGGKMLVVLRVFNADKNAAFLFGPLMAMWRFIGPYVTVSDPSYVRYEFTIFQRANITRTLGTTLTIMLAVFLANHLPPLFSLVGVDLPPWLEGKEHEKLLQALVYAAVAVAAIVPAILYLWRRFLKRPEQAVAQVDRAAAAGLGVESDYRGSALFCFDDVWKPAVGHMLEVADLILMDLRGFSAERQGCAYEIGQLIDHFPVDRLLLLVDADTPRDLLSKLIAERWAAMAPTSPNRAAPHPLIRFYQTGDREQRDIRNIIGLLSMSLEGPTTIHPGGFAGG